MPDSATVPPARLLVVTSSEAQAEGFTQGAVTRLKRSGGWHPLFHGVYLVGWSGARPRWGDLPALTRAEAALARHGPGAVLSHATAAWVHRLPARPVQDPTVHVTLPTGRERHQVPGIELHFRRLARECITTRPAPDSPQTTQYPCTTVAQTLADVLRTWNDWSAVSALDFALSNQLVDGSVGAALEPMLWRQRGAVDARRRLALADGRAQSPLETRIRLIAAAAGLPPDELQLPVRDSKGHVLGVADLAWRKPDGRTLVVEADGRRWHELPDAILHDRRRANAFVGTGQIDMVRFVWEDTRRPRYVESVLREHLHRR